MKRICPPGYHDYDMAEAVYNPLLTAVFSYIKYSGIKGNVLEFGSYKGYSARKIAQYINEFGLDSKLTLFDSWVGMPEISSPEDINSYEVAVLNDWKLGSYGVPEDTPSIIQEDIAEMLGFEKIELVQGYYQDTLKSISFAKQSISVVNIDCDLYESISLVLKKLVQEEALMDGTVILFDDYNFNRANPDMGARKAIDDIFVEDGRYSLSFFLNYSWHGRAFIIHDKLYKVS